MIEKTNHRWDWVLDPMAGGYVHRCRYCGTTVTEEAVDGIPIETWEHPDGRFYQEIARHARKPWACKPKAK